MKATLLLIFCIVFLQSSFARFEVIVLDEDIKIKNKKLKKVVKKVKRKPSSKKFLMGEDRDYFLEKHFPDFIADKDNMDRDIFYKKLMTYPYEELNYQYDWLTREAYDKFIADVPPLD